MQLKKLLLIAILSICIISPKLSAQDDNLDTYFFETEEVQEETVPYFVIGGGYTATFFSQDFTELNSLLQSTFPTKLGVDHKDMDGTMIMHGGFVGTGIPWAPNFRFGFFSIGGNKTLSYESKDYKLQDRFSLLLPGLSVDYGIVLFKHFAVLPGVNIGYGKMTIERMQTTKALSTGKDYLTLDSPNANMRELTNNFIFIQPKLSIEYALYDFLVIKANANYSMTASTTDWTANSEHNLGDGGNGLKDLKTKGFAFQLGLFVGLFNY